MRNAECEKKWSMEVLLWNKYTNMSTLVLRISVNHSYMVSNADASPLWLRNSATSFHSQPENKAYTRVVCCFLWKTCGRSVCLSVSVRLLVRSLACLLINSSCFLLAYSSHLLPRSLTHSCTLVFFGPFIYLSWSVHLFELVRSFIWAGPFIYLSWSVHLSELVRSFIWAGPFIYLSWSVNISELVR